MSVFQQKNCKIYYTKRQKHRVSIRTRISLGKDVENTRLEIENIEDLHANQLNEQK